MSTTRVTPFGRELKRLRAERCLTTRDLAGAIQKSVAYVAKIETRGEIPNGELICAIAGSLGLPPEPLLQLAKESLTARIQQKIDRQHTLALNDYFQTTGLVDPYSEPISEAKRMTTAISLINMKGGVGKTTLAMQIAHAADIDNYRVLAVDLDPQSNLSQALMTPVKYREHLRKRKPTVVQIFDGYSPAGGEDDTPRKVDVNDVILKKAGYWSDTTLDLIPSRLELSRTLKDPYGKERRLAKALGKVSKNYDLIIIDCAPTESVLTEAAYFASRYIVVPVKPEFMATIGLPLLARSVEDFQAENDDHTISIAGLVFNHSSSYSAGPEGQQSIREVTAIAEENDWYVCENQVKYSATYAKSAREGTPLSRTSYARGDVIRGFGRLKDELFGVIGVERAAK